MKNELRINQLSTAAFTWYQAYLQSVDEQDASAFAAFLADDATFQFGNQPPVQGKQVIVDGQHVSLPAVAITERNEHGLVTSFRVFIDIATLYAPAEDLGNQQGVVPSTWRIV